MNDFKFSIITAIYNSERFLAESIESVINQDMGFEDNVQLILVDDGSTDNSREIALDYKERYPNNIVVLTKENGGVASARNLGLKHVNGKFVNFLDSDDRLSLNALNVVCNFFKKHPDIQVVSMPLKFFDKREGDHYLNYKFENEGVINLDEKFDYPQMHISSSFIDIDAFKDYEFNTRLVNGSDSELLTRIMIDVNQYGVVNSAHYNYRKRQDESSIMDTAKASKRFFTEKMHLYHKKIINECIEKRGEVTPYIQYLVLLEIGGIIKSPYYDDIFDSKDETLEFWQCLDDILTYIDKDIILDHRYYNHDLKMFLTCIKNKDFFTDINRKKHKVWLKSKDRVINRLHNHNLHLESIAVEKDNLVLTGYFSSNCKNEVLCAKAILDTGKSYDADFIKSIDNVAKRYLGVDWKFKYIFRLNIPLDNDNFKFRLVVDYNEDDKHIEMHSDIALKEYCSISPENNWILDNTHYIIFEDNEFHIIKNSMKNRLKMKYDRI